MVLDGQIERPRVDLFFDRPNEAMGLTRHAAAARSDRGGLRLSRERQSRLGPFTSNGQILLPNGGRATIAIAALNVGGRRRAAICAPIRAGSPARWRWPAAGSTGRSLSRRSATRSRSRRICAANGVRFPGIFAVRTGRLDGTIILADERTTIDGMVDARGLEASGISLARLTANAKLVNGSGQVRAAIAGRRGAAFDFTTLADVTPDSIRLTGQRRDRAAAAGACARRRC